MGPPPFSTTMQNARRSTGTRLADLSITLRTGVHLVPMISWFVIRAPSQWKKFKTSGPDTPGVRALADLHKQTLSKLYNENVQILSTFSQSCSHTVISSYVCGRAETFGDNLCQKRQHLVPWQQQCCIVHGQ